MESDDDTTGALTLEQRTTDRLLNDLKTSGYRDARQRFMEDEQLIQSGFDHAYRVIVRLGFQVGQVRASASRVRDSAVLASINHRLDSIERFPFESLAKSPEEGIGCVIELVNDTNQRLAQLNDVIKSEPFMGAMADIFAYLDSKFIAGDVDLPDGSGLVDDLNEKIHNFDFNKTS